MFANALFLVMAIVTASEASMFGDALYGFTKVLGTAENAISPEAFIGFCNTNGYTVWKGDGPQPVDSGAASKAWSAYGTLMGKAVGAWLPEEGMLGKCDAAGWAKPEGVQQQPNANVIVGTQFPTGNVGQQVVYYDRNGNTVNSNGAARTVTTVTTHTTQQQQVQPQPTSKVGYQVTQIQNPPYFIGNQKPTTIQISQSQKPVTLTPVIVQGRTILIDSQGQQYCKCG